MQPGERDFRNSGGDFMRQLPRRSRRLIAAQLLICTLITGCGKQPPPPLKGRTLAAGTRVLFIAPPPADPRAAAIVSGAQRQVRDADVLILECARTGGDTTTAEALAAKIDARPSAICIFDDGSPTTSTLIKRAVTHADVVVTIGDFNDFDTGSGVYGHVSTDLPATIELLAKSIPQLAAERRSFVLAYPGPRDGPLPERFRSAIGSATEPRLLSESAFDAGDRGASASIRRLVDLFPNTSLVVTLAPAPWLESPPELLLAPNQAFATVGSSPQLWRALREGRAIALAGPLDGDVGATAIQLAIMGLTAAQPGPVFRAVKCELVTEKTLYDFASRYAASAGVEVGTLLPTSQP